MTTAAPTVWTDWTVASALEHLDQLQLDAFGADGEWRAEMLTEGDIDEEEPSADWALRLVLHAHESRSTSGQWKSPAMTPEIV